MQASSGHWHAVLSSRELKDKPVGKMRFGQKLVFWRDADGRAVAMDDRCPHRGASLCLGRIRDGTIACPYHGFRFAADGRCIEVPAEGTWHIPEHFRAMPVTVRESQDYVWLWRGPEVAEMQLPDVPLQPVPARSTVFAECVQHWPAHYSRCVEGVIDHSHLPYVHRKTLGLFQRDPVTRVSVEDIDNGFRVNLMKDDKVRHHVELTFPNIWIQNLNDGYGMSTAFAPIDDETTEVYCRLYHTLDLPGIRGLVGLWNRFTQFMVFHEDMPILATQRPRNVDDAGTDKLVPSDAAQVVYRKLRKQMRDEFGDSLLNYSKTGREGRRQNN